VAEGSTPNASVNPRGGGDRKSGRRNRTPRRTPKHQPIRVSEIARVSDSKINSPEARARLLEMFGKGEQHAS
jgi:hypothetical protein